MKNLVVVPVEIMAALAARPTRGEDSDVVELFDLADVIFDGEDHEPLTPPTSMEAVAVEAGIFASRGQARKAGFTGSIPHGVGLYGTKHKRAWVWSPEPPATTPTLAPAFSHADALFAAQDEARRTKFGWGTPQDQRGRTAPPLRSR